MEREIADVNLFHVRLLFICLNWAVLSRNRQDRKQMCLSESRTKLTHHLILHLKSCVCWIALILEIQAFRVAFIIAVITGPPEGGECKSVILFCLLQPGVAPSPPASLGRHALSVV